MRRVLPLITALSFLQPRESNIKTTPTQPLGLHPPRHQGSTHPATETPPTQPLGLHPPGHQGSTHLASFPSHKDPLGRSATPTIHHQTFLLTHTKHTAESRTESGAMGEKSTDEERNGGRGREREKEGEERFLSSWAMFNMHRQHLPPPHTSPPHTSPTHTSPPHTSLA